MKRIILSGANGAMGHEIAACINNRDDCKIVAGLDINTNVYSDFPIYNNADELTCGADVIIDFSHVSVLTPLLAYATKGTHSCGTLYNRIYRISSKRIKEASNKFRYFIPAICRWGLTY